MNAEAVLKKAEAWRLSSRLLMQAKEKAIEALLLLAALTSVAITIGIVGVTGLRVDRIFPTSVVMGVYLRSAVDSPLLGAALRHFPVGLRHPRDHGRRARCRGADGQSDGDLSE